jgi:hypothetical protein
MTWLPGGTQTPDARRGRALRKGWALTRWAFLVFFCGVAIATLVDVVFVGLMALVKR